MNITAADIRNRTFRKSVRGYDRRDVEAFLELIAAEWETVMAERTSLEQKTLDLERQILEFRTLEKGFQQSILQAQEASGKAIDSAKREGHLIIREAEQRAAQLLEKARNDLTHMKEQVAILGARRDSIASRLTLLLNSELEIVRSFEDGAGRGAAADVPETEGEGPSERKEIEEIIRNLGQ